MRQRDVEGLKEAYARVKQSDPLYWVKGSRELEECYTQAQAACDEAFARVRELVTRFEAEFEVGEP